MPKAYQDVDASTSDLTPKLTGGKLLSAISNTFVSMLREFYGRGPMKAKTYALDDIIVVVLRDSGYSAIEKTMMDSGEPERVVEMREDFQRVMAQRYTESIESLTGRQVIAFISQAHVDPDITIEIFFIDRPLDGFGAVEIIDREAADVIRRTLPSESDRPPRASGGGARDSVEVAPRS